MLSLREFVVVGLALLLCSWTRAEVNSAVRISSKNLTLPKTSSHQVNERFITLGNTRFTDDENTLSYMLCQKHGEKAALLCNVTVESSALTDGTHINICDNVNITNGDNIEWSFDLGSSLWSFNSKRSIILTHGKPTNFSNIHDDTVGVQILILDMTKCSTVAKFVVTDDSNLAWSIHSILYHDSFDLILSSRRKCGDKLQRCRVTYNLEGRQISDPKPYEPMAYAVFPVAQKTSDKGYYAYEPTAIERSTVWYVDAAGQAQELVSNFSAISYYARAAFSNAHELFSLCWLGDVKFEDEYLYPVSRRQVHCVQTDTNGLRLNVSLELPHNTTWVAVHNLADEGLLVATGNCDVTGKHAHCKGAWIQRIAADGQQSYGALNIGGFEIPGEIDHDIHIQTTENDENEFCLSGTWIGDANEYTNLRYEKRCVPTKNTLIPHKNLQNAA